MLAYAASQWQATGLKNQLTLGPFGKQAVINAQNFLQISTINLPDPGTASTRFVLTDSKQGSQTIQGNLIVTGIVTSQGGSSGDDLLNGDLVFSNAANRSIRFNAPQTNTGSTLSIIGNASTGDAGGNLELNGGAGAPSNDGGAILITSGGTSDTGGSSGRVAISTAANTEGISGTLTITTGDSGQEAGSITIQPGSSTSTATAADLILKSGDTSSSGDQAGDIIIVGGTGKTSKTEGGDIWIDAGTGVQSNGAVSIGTLTAASNISIGNADMTTNIEIFKTIVLDDAVSIKATDVLEGFFWTPITGTSGTATTTANGRSGRASFTGVAIAGNTTVTFTVQNSSAKSSGLALFSCGSVPPDASEPFVATITWTSGNIAVAVRNRTATTTGSLNWNIDFLCFD